MAFQYMLDTNICIYISKKKPVRVLKKLEALSIGDVCISIITYGELQYGAHKSQYSEQSLKQLELLIQYIPVVSLPNNTAKHYGSIRAALESRGQIIGNNDLWIAAHAISLDVTLVTNNEKEFRRIKKLAIENWAK